MFKVSSILQHAQSQLKKVTLSLAKLLLPAVIIYCTSTHLEEKSTHLEAGAEPGINYEGPMGVHKSMNIVTKGEGVLKSIALCNKAHQRGVQVSPMPPSIRYCLEVQ